MSGRSLTEADTVRPVASTASLIDGVFDHMFAVRRSRHIPRLYSEPGSPRWSPVLGNFRRQRGEGGAPECAWPLRSLGALVDRGLGIVNADAGEQRWPS